MSSGSSEVSPGSSSDEVETGLTSMSNPISNVQEDILLDDMTTEQVVAEVFGSSAGGSSRSASPCAPGENPNAAATGCDERAADDKVEYEDSEDCTGAGSNFSKTGEQAPVFGSSYRLGRSRVTDDDLDEYVRYGLLHGSMRSYCRAPDLEEIPAPEPYEAVVFRDFFVAGQRLLCENFVGEVLQCFQLQIHHLTPNTFAFLVVFAIAMKMMGSALSVNEFAQHYETHLHSKMVKHRCANAVFCAEYGSYNFVPRKHRGTISIVPAYRNKWPHHWSSYSFYHRICTDKVVVEALENDLPRASVLVSQMTPMVSLRLPTFSVDGDHNIEATDTLAVTSRRQTSRDLVEEWVALGRSPLSTEMGFEMFEEKKDYLSAVLDVSMPENFALDFDFVNFIESKTEEIIGPYADREHKAKVQCLAGRRLLNRVFDAMGVVYADSLGPSTSLPAAPIPAKKKVVSSRRARGRGPRGGRRLGVHQAAAVRLLQCLNLARGKGESKLLRKRRMSGSSVKWRKL